MSIVEEEFLSDKAKCKFISCLEEEGFILVSNYSARKKESGEKYYSVILRLCYDISGLLGFEILFGYNVMWITLDEDLSFIIDVVMPNIGFFTSLIKKMKLKNYPTTGNYHIRKYKEILEHTQYRISYYPEAGELSTSRDYGIIKLSKDNEFSYELFYP